MARELDFAQIDDLLEKLKSLEREERCYEREIKHSEQRLRDTVDAKLRVFRVLKSHGIQNTFDLNAYLALRKTRTDDNALLLDDQVVITRFQ